MPLITRVLMAAIGFCVLLVIVHLVRRKQLDEKYALLWLLSGLAMVVMPLRVGSVDALATHIGIHYPPAFVLLVAVCALCLISLQYSVVLTRMTRHNKVLAQRLALLEQRLGEVERQPSATAAGECDG